MAKLSSSASASRLVHTRTVNGMFASSVATQPVTGKRSSLKNPPHSCVPEVPTNSILLQQILPLSDTYASSLSLSVKCAKCRAQQIYWFGVCYEYHYLTLPTCSRALHIQIAATTLQHHKLLHTHTHTHTCTLSLSLSLSLSHAHTHTYAHTPGIDFEEVEFHRVHARGQVERLFYVGSRTLQTITAAYCAKIAARGDPTTVPAAELWD